MKACLLVCTLVVVIAVPLSKVPAFDETVSGIGAKCRDFLPTKPCPELGFPVISRTTKECGRKKKPNRPCSHKLCCRIRCETAVCPAGFFNDDNSKKKATPFDWKKKCCSKCRHVPSSSDIQHLAELLEKEVSSRPHRAAQFLRMAFHEAGTFNKAQNHGGVNGCLLTHGKTQEQGENSGLADTDGLEDEKNPIGALHAILNLYNTHEERCMSAADITQFAGLWAVARQTASGAITTDGFKWGRPDITTCDHTWTENLPGFTSNSRDLDPRMNAMNTEITEKMVNRNGFTVGEAVVLVGGAHSLGRIRSVAFAPFAGPWVETSEGDNGAGKKGGKFGNEFFQAVHKIGEVHRAGKDICCDRTNGPLDRNFASTNWWQFAKTGEKLNLLDSDVALGVHPTFASHSSEYANNEAKMLTDFKSTYLKMSELGWTQTSTH